MQGCNPPIRALYTQLAKIPHTHHTTPRATSAAGADTPARHPPRPQQVPAQRAHNSRRGVVIGSRCCSPWSSRVVVGPCVECSSRSGVALAPDILSFALVSIVTAVWFVNPMPLVVLDVCSTTTQRLAFSCLCAEQVPVAAAVGAVLAYLRLAH